RALILEAGSKGEDVPRPSAAGSALRRPDGTAPGQLYQLAVHLRGAERNPPCGPSPSRSFRILQKQWRGAEQSGGDGSSVERRRFVLLALAG
ncbi:MAG: hypothetical protein ACREMU_01015, partial [Gemmatimonadaceae bacterium]